MKDFNDLEKVDQFDFVLLNDYEKKVLKSNDVELYLIEDVTDNEELETEIILNNNSVKGLLYNGYTFLVYPNNYGNNAKAEDYYSYFSITH